MAARVSAEWRWSGPAKHEPPIGRVRREFDRARQLRGQGHQPHVPFGRIEETVEDSNVRRQQMRRRLHPRQATNQ